MWKEIECKNCSGSGENICDRCGGSGSLPGFATFGGGFTACDVCGGNGYVSCLECSGSGYTEKWVDDEDQDQDNWGDEEEEDKYNLIDYPEKDEYSYGINKGYLAKNITETELDILHNQVIGVPFKNRDNAEKWFKDGEKLLSDFIQKSNGLSSNFSTWKELILTFNNHLSYTPRKNRIYESNIEIVQEGKKIVFGNRKMIEEPYTFKPLEHILTNEEYDTRNILLEYLKVKIAVYKNPIEPSKEESNKIKHKDRYLAIKLLNELIIKFTGSAYLENRKLALLFDDLKVLSMILRIGMYQRWILEDEFFDITHKIWLKLLFPSESHIGGLINYRLNNETVNIDTFISADFSASMLAWIFMIKAPNNPKYIQFLWSVVSIYYNNNWIFYGGDKEEINKELNKTLLAIYGYADAKSLFKALGAFWKLILKTGNSFQNLILKLSNYKVVDFKDAIGAYNVQAGELLWQGKDAFYIVQHSYFRSAKTKNLSVDVISTNTYEPNKKFQAHFTIPLKGLLQINNTFIGKEDKKSIINFINYSIFKFNDYTALIENKKLVSDEIKDTKVESLSAEIDGLKIQKLYEETAEKGDALAKYHMGNR